MKSAITLATLGVGVSALVPRIEPRASGPDGEWFTLTAHGPPNVLGLAKGAVGQLADGQNRIGGGYPAGEYRFKDGKVWDKHGRGCILTPPTSQWQCDEGATPTDGFEIDSKGNLFHHDSWIWWVCPVNDAGVWNIYKHPAPGQKKCIGLANISIQGGPVRHESPSSSAYQRPSRPIVQTLHLAATSESSLPASQTSSLSIPASSSSSWSTQSPLPSSSSSSASSASSAKTTPILSFASYAHPTSSSTKSTATLSSSSSSSHIQLPSSSTKTIPILSFSPYARLSFNSTKTTPALSFSSYAHAPSSSTRTTPVLSFANYARPASNSTKTTSTRSKATSQASIHVPTSSTSTSLTSVSLTSTSSTPAASTSNSSRFTSSSSTSSASIWSSSSSTTPSSTTSTWSTSVATLTYDGISGVLDLLGSPGSPLTCPINLDGEYEFPHFIVPVYENEPDRSSKSSLNGTVAPGVHSIFNFDIHPDHADKTCSLVFFFPEQWELETSAFTYTGHGALSFSALKPADSKTTWKNKGRSTLLAVQPTWPGHNFHVATAPCPAGEKIAIEVGQTGDLTLNYFQDFNPAPIGLYVTVC